jgi:ATP-dependent Clp protease ATP-binding subunit ClpC
MFERFTDPARRVVVLAQEEARLLNHNYIGTEHILLGLVREGEGKAAQVLLSLRISLDECRARIQEIIGRGTDAPSGHIPFTPRAKKVLELSLREALQLGHNYIGTEHLLIGLLREEAGVAAQVLVKLGLDLATVREQVLAQVSGREGQLGEVEPGPVDALLIENRRLRGEADNFRRALAADEDDEKVLRSLSDENSWLDGEIERLAEKLRRRRND